jgi:hypothetical protein
MDKTTRARYFEDVGFSRDTLSIVFELFLLSAIVAGPAWVMSLRKRYFSIFDVILPAVVTITWILTIEIFVGHIKSVTDLTEPLIASALTVIALYAKPLILAYAIPSKYTATAALYSFCLIIAASLALVLPPFPT